MIIDIRDTSDFKKKSMAGSFNIPERTLKDSIDFLNTFEEVIFVCPTGINARRIAHKYKDILKGKVDAQRLRI